MSDEEYIKVRRILASVVYLCKVNPEKYEILYLPHYVKFLVDGEVAFNISFIDGGETKFFPHDSVWLN